MLFEKALKECEICDEEEKRDRRPKVSTYRAVVFNKSVAIDLTEWFDGISASKKTIGHMIDEYSRLSAAGVVKGTQRDHDPECGTD